MRAASLPPVPVWTPDCSVGVPELDLQHIQLFRLVAQLQERVETGQSGRALADAFTALAHYARTHFAAEETVMREAGFPGAGEHAAEHERFGRKVGYFARSLQLGKPGVGREVVEYLHSWLVDHVRSRDRAYALHLAGRKRAPTAGG